MVAAVRGWRMISGMNQMAVSTRHSAMIAMVVLLTRCTATSCTHEDFGHRHDGEFDGDALESEGLEEYLQGRWVAHLGDLSPGHDSVAMIVEESCIRFAFDTVTDESATSLSLRPLREICPGSVGEGSRRER